MAWYVYDMYAVCNSCVETVEFPLGYAWGRGGWTKEGNLDYILKKYWAFSPHAFAVAGLNKATVLRSLK